MALVNGPLFSLSASGQLGKALVYSRWKGRDYVREYVIPANPRTLAQFIQRGFITAASRWWAGLANEAGAQASWDGAASAQNISAFNALVSDAADKMRNDDAPVGYDGGGTAVSGDTTSCTPTSPTPGNLEVVVEPLSSWTDSELLVIAIGTDGGAAATAEHMNQVISGKSGLTGSGSVTFELSDLPPGDYYVAATVIGTDGSAQTFTPSASAVTIA